MSQWDKRFMNPLIGSSLYDSLNRLVIGFLLSLWLFIIPIFDKYHHILNDFLGKCGYVIFCFVLGLFFSLLIDCISEIKKQSFIKFFFYKNNLKRITKISEENDVPLSPTKGETEIETYYKYYYSVQESHLLGNVPALETLSAFLLNLCGVSLVSSFLSLVLFYINPHCCCNCSRSRICFGCILILSIIILLLGKICRDYIEGKIYSSIILAYKYIKTSKS